MKTEYVNPNLQEIEVIVISQEECQMNITDDEITDSMICAYAEGKDTCRVSLRAF